MTKMLFRNFSAAFLSGLATLIFSGCDEPAKTAPSTTSIPAVPSPVRLADIADGKKLIGSLGKPIFTVVKIRGVFTDMTSTRIKSNDGRIALKISSVDGVPLATQPCLDFVAGEFRTDDGATITNEPGSAKACIGKQFTGYAYERVNSAGTPSGVFRYEPLVATTGPFLKSEVILIVNAKDAANREKSLAQ